MNNASGAHRTDSNATNSWKDINLKEEKKSKSYETTCLQKTEMQRNIDYAKELRSQWECVQVVINKD